MEKSRCVRNKYFSGTKEWVLSNGDLHREDGPAYTSSNGTKEWYLNGKRHRANGPAVEYADGSKLWYLNNELHRIDGPAVEWNNSSMYNSVRQWWLNGKLIDCETQEEFERLLKLKAFL